VGRSSADDKVSIRSLTFRMDVLYIEKITVMEKWLQTVSGDRNDSVSFHTEFIVCDKKIRPFSGFAFLLFKQTQKALTILTRIYNLSLDD